MLAIDWRNKSFPVIQGPRWTKVSEVWLYCFPEMALRVANEPGTSRGITFQAFDPLMKLMSLERIRFRGLAVAHVKNYLSRSRAMRKYWEEWLKYFDRQQVEFLDENGEVLGSRLIISVPDDTYVYHQSETESSSGVNSDDEDESGEEDDDYQIDL
jgi:hypothetical protein